MPALLRLAFALALLSPAALAQAPLVEVGGAVGALGSLETDPIDYDRTVSGFATVRVRDWGHTTLGVRATTEIAPARQGREGTSYLVLAGPELDTKTGLPLHLGLSLQLGVAHFAEPGGPDTYFAGDLQARLGHRFGPVRVGAFAATSLWANPIPRACPLPEPGGTVDCGGSDGFAPEGRSRVGLEVAFSLFR